ncbi:MAG: YfhO family protein, partial [Oscillospiraceae bacterium]
DAQHIMWHDVVRLLPQACYGVDRIVQGTPATFYTVVLALANFANIYIAYMAGIFLVLYFLYSMALRPKEGAAGWKKAGASFAGGSLLAGGLCGGLLLPVLVNLNSSKGSLLEYQFSLETKFPLLRLPERLIWGNFVWGTDIENGMPQLYCGVLALLLLGCFFASLKIAKKEKLVSAGLLAILVLSFWVQGLDVLWHGLKEPIWFPHRYSYLFSFFAVLLAAAAVGKGAVERHSIGLSALVLGLGLFAMALFPQGTSRSKILLTAILLLGFAFVLFIGQRVRGKWLQKLLAVGLVAAVALELGLHGYYIANQFEKYSYSGYDSYVENVQQTLALLPQNGRGNYRVEKIFERSLNDSMLFGYKGITHFGSTQDSAAVNFLEALGYRSLTRYAGGSTAFADSVLGLAYVLGDGVRPLPAHLQTANSTGPYTVYQNPYVLPLLFAIPETEAGFGQEAASDGNPIDYQNNFYKALTGSSGLVLNPVETARMVTQSGQEAPLTGSMPAGAKYVVTAKENGYYYAYLTNNGEYSFSLLMGGYSYEGYFSSVAETTVINLGYLQAGETADFSFDNSFGIEIASAQFVYTPLQTLEELAQNAAENAGDFTIQDGYISGSIEATGSNTLLYAAIPYDQNWQATVNGVPVEIQEFMGAVCAIPLQQGNNRVELRYKVPLAWPGVLVTAASAGGLAVGAAICRRKKRKKEEQAV